MGSGIDAMSHAADQLMQALDAGMKDTDLDAPRYARKAFIWLERDKFPRKQCIQLLEKWWFDPFVLTLIMMNCITMILFNEPVMKSMISGTKTVELETNVFGVSSWARNSWMRSVLSPLGSCGGPDAAEQRPCSSADWVDFVFLVLFAVEMIVKMLAFGLCMHKNSYLRSSWNWLDFLVVVVGFLETFTVGLPAVSTLRLIKTLRPLRSLQRVRGMRVLVQCIMEAMPQMCNVGLFLLFVLVVFGLIAISLFKGKLRHSCHAWNGEEWETTDDVCDAQCTWDEATLRLISCQSLGPTTFGQENYHDPGIWTYSCRPGQQCLCNDGALAGTADPGCSVYSNPNYAITSFDSLPWAMLALFQAISLEGWVDMMYQLMDGCSMWVFIFFIALVLLGAIIVMNLFLAVLCDNFEMADKDGEPKEKEESGEAQTNAALRDLSHTDPVRKFCLALVKNKYFDWFVQGCIVLNTFLMMVKTAPYPAMRYNRGIDPNLSSDLRNSDYMQWGLWMFLTVMNLLLTAVFTFESIVKIIGLGPSLFMKDQMNVFDFVVVLFSILDIVIDLMGKLGGSDFVFPLPLSVLRAFRIFRLFKLVKSVDSLRKILVTLAQSMASVVYLALLLFLIMIIFILLGMELFGGYYPRPSLQYTRDNFGPVFAERKMTWDDDWPSRYHFDDFGTAFLNIFIVLSGENWNEIMFDNHRATWDANRNSEIPLPYAIIYFLALFVIGNLLLFNLFIAILLSNFDDDEEEEAAEEEEEDEALAEVKGDDPDKPSRANSVGKVKPTKDEAMMTWQFNSYMPTTSANLTAAAELPPPTGAAALRKANAAAEANGVEEQSTKDEAKPQQPIFPATASELEGITDKSCKIFDWNNPVRRFAARTITHWTFEGVIVFLILFSTVTLIMDVRHLPSTDPLKVFIFYCNWIFSVIFTIEMVLKMIATGVVKSSTPRQYMLAQPYLCVGWNILDFVIVVVSWISLIPNAPTAINPLRALRALRPLRLVSRWEDLKITVNTLLSSIPAMISLLSVAMLFFLIFAILGMELFGGRLGYCADPLFADEPYGSRVIPGVRTLPSGRFQSDYEECMSLPRYNLSRHTTDGIPLTVMADLFPDADPPWTVFVEFPQWFQPQFGTFNNVGEALMLLFEISALEGWPDVLHWMQDSDLDEMFVVPWRVGTAEDNGNGGVGVPMELHKGQPGMAGLFMCLWIFVGCFVTVNMTIGVVVDTFSQIKAENDGLLLMTEDAADWVKAQKQVLAQRPLVQPAPPTSSWRLNVYYVVTSTKFELAIMSIILLNMVAMGVDWWEPAIIESTGAPNLPWIVQLKQAMTAINIAFLAIYVLEMLVKWIGLTMPTYFCNPWDVFDFLLVVVSCIEVGVTLSGDNDGVLPIPPTLLRVLRLARVVRILRVIKTAKQLRTIILTVYISLPQLRNILVLIILMIIIFDMLCVNIFSYVNYTPGNFDPTYHHNVSKARGEIYFPDDYYYSDTTNWGDQINRHANFQYWWTGMLTLVRSSTGESFNGIMHDLYGWNWGHNRMTCCPQCGPILDGPAETLNVGGVKLVRPHVPDSSCGDTFLGFIIYFIFQLVMAYIVLSIMIGVILENFANVGSETRRIRIDDIEEFREVWLKYDPKGTFIVPSHNLLAILQQLREPLGIAGHKPALTRAEMLKHLGKLDIPDHGGYIHFMETLTAITYQHAGVPVPICDTTKKMQKAAQSVPHLRKLDKPAHNALTNYLVSLLQSRWRGYAMRKQHDVDGEPLGGGAGGPAPPMSADYAQKVKSNQVAPEPQ